MNRKVLFGGLAAVAALIALFAVSFGKDPHEIRSPLIGHAAPPFTLRPLDGGAAVSLADLRGKPAILNFWATWCQPCQAEHGVLRSAARNYGDGVRFLGIVYEDEPAKIQEFLDRHGSGYTTLIDQAGKTAISYGVYGVPETFFLDPSGTIVAKHAGPLSPADIAGYLRPLLAAR